ncbi:tellurite resistance-related uncharacterized protein [Sphingobium sp. B1D7B]|uniref:DUF1971 domain-containing protein n=1 Tax=Sphingobium sp. B1D7B TaxID=2940578 RepID=UPI00222597B5|nr:DUF1971 domain-containing protein [Sphingobium sp. B1D7B]MCW2404593.1 tellurite resistance-related uncharacterized protein [Sphingobium sp. B1D7B]
MTAELPFNVASYQRTPTFSEETIPDGLRKDHSTKDGTWGLVHVEEGELLFVVTDPRRPSIRRVLTAAKGPGLVEPTLLHHIELLGPVRFYVEFFKA